MLSHNRTILFLALASLSLPMRTADAQKADVQKGPPYSLDMILMRVKAGVEAPAILNDVNVSCIDFRLTSANVERLRAAGAKEDLIKGLRSTCNKADSKEGGDVSDNKRRDVRREVTPPKKKPTVTPPVTPRPVVYPPPTVYPPVSGGNTASVSWDFRSSQPLTAGRYTNCQYDYSPAGYTVSVMEYGGSCLDGSSIEWGDNVRITTVATPVSGSQGYTYGLRFGISDDTSIGYYAFEVSSFGHYELSRYRNGKWEVVYPWKTGSGINANSTNTITADIRGSTVNFIINGITQYTYQAPGPIRGRVGFGIIGFDKGTPLPVVTFASFSAYGQRSTVTPFTTTTTTPVTSDVTTSGSVVDWDLGSSQPLTAGRYGKCDYQYASGGYTISVAEAGTTCFDGPAGSQPANVSISATARGLRGLTGYTYGIRFGYTTDSTVGYYAFEVSEGGSSQLSRYRMNRWEPLIPWQRLTVINPASSGMSNMMRVEIRGRSVTLYVNGSQVGTYQTPYAPIGPAGFGIIGYEQSEPLPSVVFTRFNVTPVGGTTVTPTTTTTTTTNSYDWDLSTSQPLTAGRYAKCNYEYSNGGYTVNVAEAGSTCIDGPSGDRPANIRVAATARGLRGGSGYTYGIRFGYTTDSSIGYYAFELSEGGSFQLSRYRNDNWESLIPWQRLNAINPASSGIPNNMAVDIRGTSITLYVNGSQVGTYQAPYAPVGPAGFGIIGYEQTAALPAVVFTRFSITPLY